MISRILYTHGIFIMLLSNVYAVYWNETAFLNVNERDSRRIRNKLVTFDTLDTDIELAFQFNVPFVAVPTDRSIGNIKNSLASFVNVNLGSVALAGVMIIFESTDTVTNIDSTPTVNESPKSEKAHESNKFIKLMNLLEATVNPTVCVQQYICSVSQLTAKNVAEGCATSSDKIVAGIFETPWILDKISETAVYEAIQFGASTGDCLSKFSKCSWRSVGSEELYKIFLKSFNVFK